VPILEQLTETLAADTSLGIVIVFGSVAEDRARADSDIDIAVAADRPLGVAEKLALIEAIAEQTGRPVDLVDLRTAGEPLLGQILQKGRRLLVRNPRLLGELISRHLTDTEDFLPYRHRILGARRASWIEK
jgi:predicted nucleotidyltransferase